jgi:hypothetical protein
MFSTDLYALLSEILVGAMTIVTLCFPPWLALGAGGERFIDWFRRHGMRVLHGPQEAASEAHQYIVYPIVGSIILGLGLAMQSAVYDVIDARPVGFPPVAGLAKQLLLSKDAYRFSALFEAKCKRWHLPYSANAPSTCDRDQPYALTKLGEEVLGHQPEIFIHRVPPLESVPKATADAWKSLLKDPATFLSPDGREGRCEVAKAVSSGIYYDASNWAKAKEPITSALRRWEIQIDTVGSLALLAFWIVAVGLTYIVLLIPRSALSQEGLALWTSAKARSVYRWTIVGALIGFFASYSYVLGQKGYTERAIGMYSSAHHLDKGITHLAGCLTLRDRWKGVLNLPPACSVALHEWDTPKKK